MCVRKPAQAVPKSGDVGGKRALEPESGPGAHDCARRDAPVEQPAKRTKTSVSFHPEARPEDGPDAISRIAADLIDGAITKRVFDLDTLQTSIQTSMDSARFELPAVYKDLMASKGGCVLVQSVILTVIHKRFQALINTIAARTTEDCQGTLTLLPSHTRIGHAFIPVLVMLQGAIHMIILDRCRPCADKTCPSIQNNTIAISKEQLASPPRTSTPSANLMHSLCTNLNPKDVHLSSRCFETCGNVLEQPSTFVHRPSQV